MLRASAVACRGRFGVASLRFYKRVDDDGDSDWDREERFVYDYAGKRDGNGHAGVDDLVLAADGEGSLTNRYLHGQRVDEFLADESLVDVSPVTLWGLTDHQGTARDIARYDDLTDETTITAHRVYDAFGGLLETIDPATDDPIDPESPEADYRAGYTGGDHDPDTALTRLGARWYDPGTGKWLSPDPIGQLGDPGNQWRYVNNDPLNGIDPSGFETVALSNGLTVTNEPSNRRADLFTRGMDLERAELWYQTLQDIQQLRNAVDLLESQIARTRSGFSVANLCENSEFLGEYNEEMSELREELVELRKLLDQQEKLFRQLGYGGLAVGFQAGHTADMGRNARGGNGLQGSLNAVRQPSLPPMPAGAGGLEPDPIQPTDLVAFAGVARALLGKAARFVGTRQAAAAVGEGAAATKARDLWHLTRQPGGFSGDTIRAGGQGRIWATKHAPTGWETGNTLKDKFLRAWRTGDPRACTDTLKVTGPIREQMVPVRGIGVSRLWKNLGGQHFTKGPGNWYLPTGSQVAPSPWQRDRFFFGAAFEYMVDGASVYITYRGIVYVFEAAMDED